MFTAVSMYPSSVISNGLYRYYDAGLPESYPGTGTDVYDLSGNGSTATLVGGMTWKNNAVGGYWDMDGSNDTLTYTGVLQAAFTTIVIVAPGTDAAKGTWNNDDGAFPGFRVNNGFIFAVQTLGSTRTLVPILYAGSNAATISPNTPPTTINNTTYWRYSAFRTNGNNLHETLSSYFSGGFVIGTNTTSRVRADSASGTIYVGRDPVLTRYPTARLMAYLHYSRRLDDWEIYETYGYFQNRFTLYEA